MTDLQAKPKRRIRVAICWAGVSGYMAACWRELAARPDVDLLVFNFQAQYGTAFNDDLLRGINCKFLPFDQTNSGDGVRDIILSHQADVVCVAGWVFKSYMQLAADPAMAHLPFVLAMDTPLRRTWRQHLARLKVGWYVDRMARVVVPGERAWQYARFLLKVPEDKLRRGVYGVDYAGLAPLHAMRVNRPGGWPKRFLFTGRYVEEKGVDVLLDAYARYRKQVPDPWPLTCCGMGAMKDVIGRATGVEDRGFLQPADLAQVMADHGVFVLSSRYDPWPLVVVEACAAGMPVICTESCGSAVELVRNDYSGLTVATGDANDLARGMLWAHARHDQLSEMGRRAQDFAAAYSAQAWADRWERILGELVA